MSESNTSYQVELEFSENQTLKELLIEMLVEKNCTFDFTYCPYKMKE